MSSVTTEFPPNSIGTSYCICNSSVLPNLSSLNDAAGAASLATASLASHGSALEEKAYSSIDGGSSTSSTTDSHFEERSQYGGDTAIRRHVAAQDAAFPAGTVGLLLQLTDIHISAMRPPEGDPQRAPDMLSLSSGLLARWPLTAAVLTGDLTEAKDVYGRSRQDKREWEDYLSAWKALASVGGVPEDQIFDTRGNHDTFNSGARCGTRDFYCLYSARAMRQPVQGNVTASDADRGPRGRVFVEAVYGKPGPPSSGDGCPLAMLVGIDASLDPGLRSPVNFLGVISAAVLDELDEQLAASIANMRTGGCSPPYIAYGHYPLSVIAYPGRRSAAGASVQEILLRHGVSAYLAGHLHGAFGRRLHRLHAARASNAAAGPATVSELERGTERQLPETAAGQAACRAAGHLLELEMVDWKYARTVRLLTLDSGPGGAVVGFQDYRYRPPSLPMPMQLRRITARRANATDEDGLQLTAPLEPFDPTASIGAYLSLITCPPDARYSPQLTTAPYMGGGCSGGAAAASASASVNNSTTAVVRVMLLPVAHAAPAVPSDAVYLHWWCGHEAVSFARAASGRGEEYEAAAQRPTSPGDHPAGHGRGLSMDGSEAHRRLSGYVRMRLESSTVNHSIFTVDLLGAAASETSAEGSAAAADADASGGVRNCPSGLMVVQARVGDGAASSSSGGRTVGSASAQRPLNWHPPQQQATLSPQRQRRDAFWPEVGPDGGHDGCSPAAQDTPAPLQLTALEWLVMQMPWHKFGRVAFIIHCCVLTVGLLAVPRVIAAVKARRALSQSRGQRQRRGHARRAGRQPRQGSGCGEEVRDTALREPLGAPAPAVAGMRSVARDLDCIAEGASTGVRLGGRSALKRSNSGSSSGGGGGGGGGITGALEGPMEGGVAAWSLGQTAAEVPASRRSPLYPEAGGSDAGERSGGSRNGHGAGRMPTGAVRAAWHAIRQWLMWPARDFAELADLRDPVPWLALALFGTYLAVGPWMVTELVDADGGAIDGGVRPLLGGYGILTAHGIYMRPLALSPPRDGAGTVILAPSQDHVVVINVVFLTCVAPALLLCASAAARLRQKASTGRPCNVGGPGGMALQWLSWRQAMALCVIAVLNALLCWKLWAGMGWKPVLLSPGIGWLLPLLAAWLNVTATRMTPGAVRPTDRGAAL